MKNVQFAASPGGQAGPPPREGRVGRSPRGEDDAEFDSGRPLTVEVAGDAPTAVEKRAAEDFFDWLFAQTLKAGESTAYGEEG